MHQAMTLPIKANKDKKPSSSPGKVELEGKSKNRTPQTTLSQMNIPSLHFYTPYYPFAKETQCSYSPKTAHSPFESVK